MKIALVVLVLTIGCYSLIANDWFQGSDLETTDLQALPAVSSSIRVSLGPRLRLIHVGSLSSDG